MIDSIIGSIFFEFIGALVKWVISAIVFKIRGKDIVSFKEIWAGRKGSSKPDLLMQGVSNILLGLLVTIGLILLLIQIDRRYF